MDGGPPDAPPRRKPGGAHPDARRFEATEDAALREAVARYVSPRLPRWSRIAEQLEERGFEKRTAKSLRNRWLRINATPTIYNDSKNRCRLCGEWQRGHSCPGRRKEEAGAPPPPADAQLLDL
jgi:hypothetical protein